MFRIRTILSRINPLAQNQGQQFEVLAHTTGAWVDSTPLGQPKPNLYVPVEFEDDVQAPAKINTRKVRVWHLAQDLGLTSASVRDILYHQFGTPTGSPSSSVPASVADAFREFVATHQDA